MAEEKSIFSNLSEDKINKFVKGLLGNKKAVEEEEEKKPEEAAPETKTFAETVSENLVAFKKRHSKNK